MSYHQEETGTSMNIMWYKEITWYLSPVGSHSGIDPETPPY